MRDKETPLALVRLWPKMADDCYDQLDNMRAAKDRGEMTWPDYCLLPINAAQTYLTYSRGLSDAEAARVCAELTACWTWRQNKIIYAFDPDLAAALAEQADDVKDSDVLPAELLMHLPYPCIYIKAPGLLEHTDGFWTWLDYDINRQGAELRIQWVLDTLDGSVGQVIHIIPDGTLQDCYLDTIQTTLEHLRAPVDVSRPADNSRILLRALQLILYILSADADIEDAPPDVRAARPQPKQPLQIIRDKAGEVQAKNVGVRIGAIFRQTGSQAPRTGGGAKTGATRRAHMRRGHWHHFWTGRKDGKDTRKLILRWVAPIAVHADKLDDEQLVIYPVFGGKVTDTEDKP